MTFDGWPPDIGAKFYGFNPALAKFDREGYYGLCADGLADFIMVAQFGNPQNVGPVGEAYLVYGQDKVRF